MIEPMRLWLVLLSVALLSVVAPAVRAQVPPTSGQLLQQVEPPPVEETAQPPEVTIEQAQDQAASDSAPFAVERIVIEGNTAFDTAMLHALVAAGEGTQLTLAGLQALAARITDYYHAHGFPLARALVPAQTLDAGTVRLQIVEARYDAVQLDNRSRVGDSLFNAILAPLAPGTLVAQDELDHSLLLLGDLPGVQPQATLRPGTEVGTSTLVVQAEPAPMFSGIVTLDNAGNQYTGRVRLGAWLQFDNPLRHGDRLSVGLLTGGEDLAYGRLGYQTTLNGHGTQVGASYSMLDYTLGGDLDALDAHGTAKVASAWMTHPFMRTRRATLEGRVQIDRKLLRDHIDSTRLEGERNTTSVTLDVTGQRRDANGITTASLGLTSGTLDFDDPVAAAVDAATANTAGSYLRWNASVARLQVLGPATRFYVALAGQASNDNLDTSEQFLLGGPGSVRGYDIGSLAGASGHLLTLELRHDLAWFGNGRTEGIVFIDSGETRINPRPWVAGDNHARLTAAGLGLNWSGPRQWTASVQVATRLGDAPALVGTGDDVHAWVRIAKGF